MFITLSLIIFGYQSKSNSKRDSDFWDAILKDEDDTLAIAGAGTDSMLEAKYVISSSCARVCPPGKS